MSSLRRPVLNGKDGSLFIHIPAGEFSMGSEDGYPVERPVHIVHVDSFYLAAHPVTNEQYCRFIRETGSRTPYVDDRRVQRENWDPETGAHPPGREQHPVVLVSWRDAQAYCKWAGGRLPTEAEWEKAARGGLAGKRYPWGDEINPTLANYDNQTGTTPVGSCPPNNYGLFDMAGNVWEWVADWYAPHYYGRSPALNPSGPETGATKVLRGGAWLLFPEFCRVAYRFRNSPGFRFNLIGFRLARSL
ncbi:MAG: formylglycine-generating enzyme family protein [Deltaproteobacteria bacterium]|nr:formylglycine-generating enzyme family protein [Deltaproteobacteria bacterium]